MTATGWSLCGLFCSSPFPNTRRYHEAS
jgi:hypothetical protein